MGLLIKSSFRYRKKHMLQTLLSVGITILVIGMLSVLFHFAASFHHSLRTYALEKNGTYHYKYRTYTETNAGDLFHKMAENFEDDDWFSKVELTEENGEITLTLTVARPNLFTTRIMKKKYNEQRNRYYVDNGEAFYLTTEHNHELLASAGDLSKENGIFSFLLVFIVLLAVIAIASIFTLVALFGVSGMQREREIALLSGMGAGQWQIVSMMLAESVAYCILSFPPGYILGIFLYGKIQSRMDNIVYSLFQFPPVKLVVSVPCLVALFFCAGCIILLSGLKSAVNVSRVSPLEVLNLTKQVYTRRTTQRKRRLNKMVSSTVYWLADKSCLRFRRRNRPIYTMLVITFTLCFVLNGFSTYAVEVLNMNYDTLTYNYAIELFSDDKDEIRGLAEHLAEISDGQLRILREAVFELKSPYPLSAFGESNLQLNGGRIPDVSFLCIDDGSFREICKNLGISEQGSGIWGIFLDTERSWWSNGVKVVGKPFEIKTGDTLSFYRAESDSEREECSMTIAGVYNSAPLYSEITEGMRIQILVPDTCFSLLETQRSYKNFEPGAYHISLRGCVDDSISFENKIKSNESEKTDIVCYVFDYKEQKKQEVSSIESFKFICKALISLFVFMCVCGNFTITWATDQTREREFATLLAVGMRPVDLRKMRLLENIHNVFHAFVPGTMAGMVSYQLIYWIYSSEYQIKWRFPFLGLLMGIAAMVLSMGITECALRIWNGQKPLSERLRIEPM